MSAGRRLSAFLPAFMPAVGWALALLVLISPSGSPVAQSPGRMLFGSRDFEMDWQLTQAGAPAKTLRVRFQAATRRLRIEALDGTDQVMIRDLASGDVVVLVANGQKGAFGAKSKPMGAFQPESRGETRAVLGETCRDFGFQGQTLCVTDDGIPLEVDLGGGKLSAERLIRQTQHPALFQVDKALKLQPIPGSGADTLPKIPF